jgi:hypothetical protein
MVRAFMELIMEIRSILDHNSTSRALGAGRVPSRTELAYAHQGFDQGMILDEMVRSNFHSIVS